MKKLSIILLLVLIALTACSGSYSKELTNFIDKGYEGYALYKDGKTTVKHYVSFKDGKYSSKIKYGSGTQILDVTSDTHIEYAGKIKNMQDLVNANLIYTDVKDFEKDINGYLKKVDEEGNYQKDDVKVKTTSDVVKITDKDFEFYITSGSIDE